MQTQICRHSYADTDMQTQICKQKYADTDMQTQICRHRYEDTDMQTQICRHRYADTDMQTQICRHRYADTDNQTLQRNTLNFNGFTSKKRLLMTTWHMYLPFIIFYHGATTPSGPRPPLYRGFIIILRHTTLCRTRKDEWSALPDNTQHSQKTDTHDPGEIRTHNPSNIEAANPRLRPRGHWDWRL
jgi:ribosomal protein L40E